MKGIQELRFIRINSDVDDHGIKPEQGEYRMIENLAPPQKGIGRGHIRESLKGTEEIPINDPEYPTTRITLGSYEDKPNGKIYYFIWASSDFHRIMVYDQKNKIVNRVIRSTAFQWTPETKITGISVLDNVIYWADPILCYYRIQDQTKFSEIDYNCREITSAIQVTFNFVADFQSGSDVNFQTNITGPLSAVDIAQQVAADMAADTALSSRFSVNAAAGSSVIKLVALTTPGSVRLTGTPATYYNYYQTNFDTDPVTIEDFYQYPRPPKYRPLLTSVVEPGIVINKILDKNWQFATRQIYLNNQVTVLSPFSEIVPAAQFIEDFTNTSIPNAIRVQIAISKPERVKSVDILARNSEDGDWFVVKTLHRAELFAPNGIMIYQFSGSEQQVVIPTADAIKQQEGTPRESIDLQIQKNKIFAIDNLTGFDYDESNMSLTVEIAEEANNPLQRYFKQGGLYNVAVRFFDEDFRTDGTVHAVTQVNIPENPSTSWLTNPTNSGKLPSRMQYLNITLNGKPPIWAKHFLIVRSDELRYGQFVQFHAPVLYYIRPEIEDDNPAIAINEFYMYGNVYKEENDITSVADWRYLHLLLPTNLPFIPERGQIVHIMAGKQVGAYDQTTILDVQGNLIILEQPVNIVNGYFGFPEIFVELYRPKSVSETNSFYEVSGTYDIVDAGLPTRSFPAGATRINGDIWVTNNEDDRLQWKYDWDDYTKNNSTQEEKGLRKSGYRWGNFETRTKTYTATQLQDIQTSEAQIAFLKSAAIVEFTADFGFVLDYNLNSKNLGRPAPLLENVREETRPSTIRFTNDYIANAAINGLHTFEPLNEYPLPLERGPVEKLQRAGEDILLAIHSSAVTSMYIGKGIIRSADLDPTLVTTDDVIGTDNELKHSFGTLHPSSVCEVDGNVFFWDGSRIEPVRYAQNGLIPLATRYGARAFFKETIPALFGDPSSYSCIAEFDRLLNMVFYMFKNDIISLTIGFHEEDNAWIGQFGFAPEYFGVIGDEFVGFINGVPHVHNQDDNNHNTFYGTTYKSKVKAVMNIGANQEKAWDSIMFYSNKIWDFPLIYNREGQQTNLVAADFKLRDNTYYADILRDENTPPAKLKPGQLAIRHGNFMSSQTITIEMETTSNEYHFLDMVGIAATIKSGHFIQQQEQQK